MSDGWDDDEGEESPHETALELLVRELLLERTKDLDAAATAAFVDGWTSLLDLLRRLDLILPGAPPELSEGLADLIRRIRAVQERALADDDL